MNDLIRLDDDDALSPPTGDRNPALVYLSSLAPSGRRTMKAKLALIARAILGIPDPHQVPWHLMRYQHVVAIRTRLQEMSYSPATVNAALYALRGVARASFNLELMDADAYQRIRDVRTIKAHRLPAGRALNPGELAALMDACSKDAGPAGVRDAAVIGLLYAGGLRRAEVAVLDLEDYHIETGELLVLGKGDKQRNIYIDNGAADALADWILIRGDREGRLLLAINKGGRVLDHGVTDQAVYNLLRKRAKQAGVRDCSCHDLRRSYISDLLDAGADISTVSKLAGHAQVQTSARYDRRGEDAKRKASALLHVPYRRRTALLPEARDDGDGRRRGLTTPEEGFIMEHNPTPRELLDHHLRTGEPLSEDEVMSVIAAGLSSIEDWEDRGGGLHWHAATFPRTED